MPQIKLKDGRRLPFKFKFTQKHQNLGETETQMNRYKNYLILLMITLAGSSLARDYKKYSFTTRYKPQPAKKHGRIECEIGKYLLKSECHKCPQHCEHCFHKDKKTTCVHCTDLFYLEDGSCVKKFDADLQTIVKIILCILSASLICLYFSRSYVQEMKRRLGEDFDYSA